ncbi:MAG: stage 0 sporulation family protein [Dehalococcoidia bacterium]
MTDRRQPHVAGIRFRNAGRIAYVDTRGMYLDTGEFVVVQTVRGPEIGRVVIAPGQVLVDQLDHDELKPILRPANDADLRRMDGLRKRAADLLPEARRLAIEAGFPARIDDADFTLDGRRLTLSFTSDERLEYREFLRRVGDRFAAKVDMRQMGARDRAKLAGGYGACGRELCCSNWLSTFPSISIRMAKEQDLPLNPQKISGLCGRLLCCLSYEEEGYKEMRKTLPKLGQRCSTPTGEGKVIALNILRRQVTLLVDGQRIDVTDRDLGTVVRWDAASKSGTPPPSMTRAEAIEQGLIAPEDEEAVALGDDHAGVDWGTVGRGYGGGRLPNRARPLPAQRPAAAQAEAPERPQRAQGRPSAPPPQGGAPARPRREPPPRDRSSRPPGPPTPAAPRPARPAAPQPSPSGPPEAKARTFQRKPPAEGQATERPPRQDRGRRPRPGGPREGSE